MKCRNSQSIMGGAGDSPAPVGGSPSGMAAAGMTDGAFSLTGRSFPLPPGGSPDGTGQWPVLPRARSQRGVALVLTLIMLAIITIVVVVFLATTRRNRQSVTV